LFYEVGADNNNITTVFIEVSQNKPAGQGTEADPYLITSLDNLKWVSTHPSSWGAAFKQTQDIDASQTQNWNSGKGFSPIGINVDSSFNGTYDGQNHKISGLYINRPQKRFVGFFGVFGSKDDSTAEVKNLHLKEVNITGGRDTGGLIGIHYGIVDGCEVSSTQGQVKGSSGASEIGGLIGSARGTVKDSKTEVDVIAAGAHAGGLAGFVAAGVEITGSHATGKVTSSEKEAGGLIGDNHGLVDHCYATGDVINKGVQYTGGLVGIGYGTIKNSYATGDVTSGGDAGGLVGDQHEPVINCHATGDVKAPGHSNGGLVGYMVSANALVKNSYATGDVTTTGTGITGGLVGYGKKGDIIKSFATGDVYTGGQYAGGLVGDLHGDIKNCYATGNAEAKENGAGGLLGWSPGANITTSYSTGKVTADTVATGLAHIGSKGSAINSYWDTETSGIAKTDTIGVGTGLKTSEMQGSNAQTNMTGFDFSGVWQTQSGDYPTLRDNPPPK
jgi:hypothetical protein